jgi:hypothetical protein
MEEIQGRGSLLCQKLRVERKQIETKGKYKSKEI